MVAAKRLCLQLGCSAHVFCISGRIGQPIRQAFPQTVIKHLIFTEDQSANCVRQWQPHTAGLFIFNYLSTCPHDASMILSPPQDLLVTSLGPQPM